MKIDLSWMIRTRRAVPGSCVWGTLSWTYGGQAAGRISYEADMRDEQNAELRLSYTRGSEPNRENVKQTIRLTYTELNYGGRRWWMICPYRRNRCGKLYLPNGGDRFAGRQAWRLGYQCQRLSHWDRPFEKMFRLQRKLGCEQGVDSWLRRPKGMHRRTFDRHLERFEELDAECAVRMIGLIAKLGGPLKR